MAIHNEMSMLHNYLKIALRSLMRNKIYSTINILGLALGVACCLLLVLYIQDEFSYDRYHNRLNDLYRITTDLTTARGTEKMRTTSPPIA
ncbi:MAG TPA: ABC transporter permease, partial [Cyclobacteriaceae bacterium]|nr:ABC transporter permease [Cyclobacteriaceae bacterium]